MSNSNNGSNDDFEWNIGIVSGTTYSITDTDRNTIKEAFDKWDSIITDNMIPNSSTYNNGRIKVDVKFRNMSNDNDYKDTLAYASASKWLYDDTNFSNTRDSNEKYIPYEGLVRINTAKLNGITSNQYKYVIIHEIGHIMGCNHGVTNNGVDDDGLHNYSIGYHFTGLDSNGYRTVMAYSRTGETRVPYFSNPNVNYQGVPTGGVPDGLAVTANNASTLQETAPFVGDYRDEVPPNEAPVANNETYTVKHGRTLTVDDKSGVLANDTDPNDDDLTAVLDTDVSSGTLSLNADGSFTYTPAEVYVSEVTFTYYATDGELNSFTATVTINIAENIKVLAYKIKRSNKLSGDGNTLKLSTELILLTELKEDDSQEVLGGVAAWKDGKDRFYHVYNAEDLEVNIGNLAADQSLQAMGVGEPGGGDLSIWLAAGKAKNTAISEVDDAIVPASLKGKEILASPNNLLAGEGKISVRFDKKITLNANNGTGGINDVIDDIVAAYEKKKHTESATDPFALPE